jgi:hypothetical protein
MPSALIRHSVTATMTATMMVIAQSRRVKRWAGEYPRTHCQNWL